MQPMTTEQIRVLIARGKLKDTVFQALGIICLAIGLLVVTAEWIAPDDKRATVMVAGALGLITYVVVNGLGELFHTDQFEEDDDEAAEPEVVYHSVGELYKEIAALEKKMQEAAKMLAFEEAAAYRDRIKELKMMELAVG